MYILYIYLIYIYLEELFKFKFGFASHSLQIIINNFQIQSPKKPEVGRKQMHLFTLHYFSLVSKLHSFFKKILKNSILFSG